METVIDARVTYIMLSKTMPTGENKPWFLVKILINAYIILE